MKLELLVILFLVGREEEPWLIQELLSQELVAISK
jgi:hypothetical protein